MTPISEKVAEITVAYKNEIKGDDRPKIVTSQSAFRYLLQGFDPLTMGLQEQFVAMFLNRGNAVLGIFRGFTGGMTGTVADIRIILGVAIKIAATSLIVAHNHPSGNLMPSRSDLELTRKLKAAAETMDIKLLDHLIINDDGTEYYSFGDEGDL